MHQNLMCLDSMNSAASANGPPSDAIKCQVLKSVGIPDQTNGSTNSLMHISYCALSFSTYQHVDRRHTQALHCDHLAFIIQYLSILVIQITY